MIAGDPTRPERVVDTAPQPIIPTPAPRRRRWPLAVLTAVVVVLAGPVGYVAGEILLDTPDRPALAAEPASEVELTSTTVAVRDRAGSTSATPAAPTPDGARPAAGDPGASSTPSAGTVGEPVAPVVDVNDAPATSTTVATAPPVTAPRCEAGQALSPDGECVNLAPDDPLPPCHPTCVTTPPEPRDPAPTTVPPMPTG